MGATTIKHETPVHCHLYIKEYKLHTPVQAKHQCCILIWKTVKEAVKMSRGSVLILLVASLLVAGCYARRGSRTRTPSQGTSTETGTRTTATGTRTEPPLDISGSIVMAAFGLVGRIAETLLDCFSPCGVIPPTPPTVMQRFCVINCALATFVTPGLG